MERKWVIAAALDITGFRSWTYRAAIAPEVQAQFLDDFYDVLECYVRIHRDCWEKYGGDALLVVKEFSVAQRREKKPILEFLLSLRCLYRKAKRAREQSENPPPGERIRIMEGYVYKKMVLDPHDPERKRRVPEYLGYCINSLKGLLEMNYEIPALATKGVVKSLGEGRSVFRVRSLGKPSCYPKGINREDVEGLEILKFS